MGKNKNAKVKNTRKQFKIMNFSILDIAVFVAYCALVIGVGLWVSRRKEGESETSEDYFLANKSLTWWAIGSSLVASNISAEQFIGMSGSGYALGLAIASYEWMAALTLLVVAKFFLPIFLEKGIYTMPHFLEVRYDKRVRTSMAIFWFLLYVFVNLTSVLYLGSLALNKIMGVDLFYAVIGLAIFSGVYSIYGGLKAVAWTDVIQVVFLIGGGLVTTYLALDAVSAGEGMWEGLRLLVEKAPERFSMIIEKGEILIDEGNGKYKDAYMDLPSISVLLGGMWIANLSYWGCNQYITQRALAAKNIDEAQKGLAFAGYLKMILPLIVVIPGIAAFVLKADISKADEAYPWLLNNFVGTGLKGLSFAALIAAVVSSLSSMVNSASTIFTMDLYKPLLFPESSEKQLVKIGRMVSIIVLVVSTIIAPSLTSLNQAFQFIQEFTGLISPGIVVLFLFGLFWKKSTANAALLVAVLSIPLSFLLKFLLPEMPFIDRMGLVFLILSVLLIVVSLIESKGKDHPRAIDLSFKLFHTTWVFNGLAFGIMLLLVLLYGWFW